MASKPVLFLVAAFLVVAVGVSHSEEKIKDEPYFKVSAQAAAPVKAPPIPAPPLIKPPAPSPPKQPTPITTPTPAPPVKPRAPPPVVKQPAPSPTPTPAPPVKPPPPLHNPPTSSPPVPGPVRTLKDCAPLCAGRCKLHSRPNVCNRACNSCCYRCKCVPPGTYGNREKCGKCYTNMTTRNNRPKCP